MGHPVRISGTEIAAALEARSREPFRDTLVSLLAAEPDPEAIKTFADRHPDRWAQTVAIFGRLAGYHDKLRVDTSIAVNVSRMSDAELLNRSAQVQALLEAPETEDAIASLRFSHSLLVPPRLLP